MNIVSSPPDPFWTRLFDYGNSNWGKDSGHTLLALLFTGVAMQWLGWFESALIGATAAGTLKEIGDRIKAKIQTGRVFPSPTWHPFDMVADWVTWQFAWPYVLLYQGQWEIAIALSCVLAPIYAILVTRKHGW